MKLTQDVRDMEVSGELSELEAGMRAKAEEFRERAASSTARKGPPTRPPPSPPLVRAPRRRGATRSADAGIIGGMDQAIIARERLPLIVSVQLGALASVLTWAFYGWMVGVPVVLVSSLAIWGSLNTGFVLDGVGLTMRSLVPGGQRQLPWNQLRGVSLDEVVVGANEGRTTQLRVRFAVDGGESPQLIGCREAVAMEVLTRFQARGLPATDARRDR